MNSKTVEQPKVNDVKIEVKKVPFRCPVCSGFGTVKYGSLQCMSCEGKGYIIVAQE